MAQYILDKFTYNGNTFILQDNNSGYAKLASPTFTGTPTAPTPGVSAGDTEIATVKYVADAMAGAGAGTVTSVGISNATNGGMSVSGSPITGSGTITIGHSNILSSAQTTQAVYPIKIDKNGHISEYGSAVTSMPASDVYDWAKASTKPSYTSSEVGAAASSHTHGNITNGGDITATAPTIASGDKIIINDESASKVTNGPSFGTSTTQYLANNGTWQNIPTVPTTVSSFTNDAGYLTSYTETDPTVPSWAKASSKPSYNFSEIGNTPTTISGYGITDALTIGTTATTAAAGNHTHTTSLATDTGTSTVTLASAGKYKLTAGGTSVIFTMPTIPTVSYPVTSVNTKTGDVTLSASDVGAAATSHAHGDITSSGDITATAPTIANGDQIVINDSSASKITNGPTFDGSTTNKYLSPKGTWESLPQSTAYTAGTGLSLSETTFNHSNSVTAQDTQALYPIAYDAQGHITSGGTAVTVPTNSNIVDLIYPVGSIYMSVNSTSPATLFGGTWSRITGRFLLAATDNGSSGASQAAGNTGGSANAIVPYHRHSVSAVTDGISGGSHTHTMSAEWSSGSGSSSAYTMTANRSTGTKTVPSTGSSHNHNLPSHNTNYAGTDGNTVGANMPPYLSVYVWKRTG